MRIVIASALDKLNSVTRLRETIRYMSGQSHEWHLVGSGKAFEAFEEEFPDSFGINYPQRAESEAEREELLWQHNRVLEGKLKRFRPHVVLVDGEYFAAKVAQQLKIPVLSFDPQHIFQFARFDITIPPAQFEQLSGVKEDTKQLPLRATHYLLPTFLKASIRSKHATLAQTALPEGLAAQPTSVGDYIQAFAWPSLQEDLDLFTMVEQQVVAHLPLRKQRANRERVLFEHEVNGSEGQVLRRRKERLPQELGLEELRSQLPPSTQHITYKVADHETWSSNLLNASAALIDGNPITIAEAIALHKPMLVIPRPDSFAQWCFGQHVEQMGLGETHPRLTRAVLEGFLNRKERYRENLVKHQSPLPTYHEALEKILAQFEEKGRKPRKQGRTRQQRKAVAGNRPGSEEE